MKAIKKNLTGSSLKMIAIITMLIDHIGAVILENGLMPKIYESILLGTSTDYTVDQYMLWSYIDLVMRLIGRMAFPIFLFLLVEGFLHTSNVYKYLLRLFIFAVVSEIPFNLALTGKFIDWDTESSTCTLMYQSVFMTLFFSLLMFILLELIHDKFENTVLIAILSTLTVIGIAAVCELLYTDYGMLGAAMAAVMYFCRNRSGLRVLFTFLLIVAYGIFTASPSFAIMESFGLLAFVFIRHYNGERGSFRFKYFFYLFYPVHLSLLALIRYLMFG